MPVFFFFLKKSSYYNGFICLCERNVGACLKSRQITAHQWAYGSNLHSFLYPCQVASVVLDVAVKKSFQACSFSTYGCCSTGSETHILDESCVNVDDRDMVCVYSKMAFSPSFFFVSALWIANLIGKKYTIASIFNMKKRMEIWSM